MYQDLVLLLLARVRSRHHLVLLKPARDGCISGSVNVPSSGSSIVFLKWKVFAGKFAPKNVAQLYCDDAEESNLPALWSQYGQRQ